MNDPLRIDGLPDDDPTALLLRDVLHREADLVRPSKDGLRRIQAEIAGQPASPRRRETRVGSLARPLLAVAAVLAVVAGSAGLVHHLRLRAAHPVATAQGDIVVTTMDQVEARSTPRRTVPVYVVGHQAGRSVLFREFRHTDARTVDAMVQDAVQLAITAKPLDPDYRRLFDTSAGTRVTARVTATQIGIDLSPAPSAAPGVTAADADLAAQQLVWTATAATAVAESLEGAASSRAPGTLQPGQRPVAITLDGRRGGLLLGLAPLDQDSDGLTRRLDATDPRADVWIGDLGEGDRRKVGRLTVTGDAVARGDGQLHAVLLRDGARVAERSVALVASEESGFKTPPRPGERGHWSLDLPLTEPGTYELVVWTGDDVEPPVLVSPAPAAAEDSASRPEYDTKTFSATR